MYERPRKIRYELGSAGPERDRERSERSRYAEEVARRMRVLLRERGMSQRELSRRTGISQSHISLLVQARRSPSPLTLRKIADALGTTPDDLLPEL